MLQGAAQRGGGGHFSSFLRFSRPFFMCSKMSFFYPKTCTPMQAIFLKHCLRCSRQNSLAIANAMAWCTQLRTERCSKNTPLGTEKYLPPPPFRSCPSTVSCTVPSCEIANIWWNQVDSQLRTQLTKQPPRSSSKGNFFCPSTVRSSSEVVQVRFCCLFSRANSTRGQPYLSGN